MNLKHLVGYFLLPFCAVFLNAQNQVFFKPPAGYAVNSTDLHIHTAFSDGSVWPNIRVDEALKEGLELISITDHQFGRMEVFMAQKVKKPEAPPAQLELF